MPTHPSQATPPPAPAPTPDHGLPIADRPSVLSSGFNDAAVRGGVEVIARKSDTAETPTTFWKIPAQGTPRGRVLLSAGIHGDEPAGVLAALRLVTSRKLHPSLEWYVAPCLSPNAFLANQRNGDNRIDPNRDFKNGRCPAIQSYRRHLVTIHPPDLHLSLHEDWEYQGAYVYELNSSDRPSLAPPMLAALRATIGLAQESCLDGHTITAPGYIFHPVREDEPGLWPEAIFLARRFPLRSYTIETPSCLPLERRVDAACATVLAAADALAAESTRHTPRHS